MTSYTEIYERALGRINSYTLTNAVNKDPIYYYRIMYPFLLNAFGQIISPEDLLIYLFYRKEPVYEIEDFKGDGIKTSFPFSFDVEVDSPENIFFRVLLDNAELINGLDYTYNPLTKSIDFTTVPSDMDAIEIHYYYVGEIVGTNNPNVDVKLKDWALEILASYVITNWKEKDLNRETLVKTNISPKDYNASSPANLLKEIKSSFQLAYDNAVSEQGNLDWKIRFLKSKYGNNYNLIASVTNK